MTKQKKQTFSVVAVLTAMSIAVGTWAVSFADFVRAENENEKNPSLQVEASQAEVPTYVELYAPTGDTQGVSSDENHLKISVEDAQSAPSGKGLTLDYTTGNSSSVSATLPLEIKEAAEGFEGIAFWVDVPETQQQYSFTMHIVKTANIVQHMMAGKTLTLVDELGAVTEQTSAKGLSLNGFTGWVMIPAETYLNAEPTADVKYDVVFEIESTRTAAEKITIGSFGYYTGYFNFLAETANEAGISKQALAKIDGYIEKAEALSPKTDRQTEVKNGMLAYYGELKSGFEALSEADKKSTSIALYNDYCARMEDYLYGEIKQTKFVMSFALMSDPHFSNTWQNPYFLASLADAKNLNPNLAGVCVLGDLSDNGVSVANSALTQLDDYYNWLDSFEYKNANGEDIPIMNIMGNHDVRGAYLDPTGAYPTSSYDPAVEMYLERENVDSIQHDRWINGYHFIFLNADRYERDDGYLNAETIDWLDETLSENEDGRPIFVMIHQQVGSVKTASDAKMTFQEVIAKHPSAIVSSGHAHSAFGTNEIIQNGEGTYINQPAMMNEKTQYYYVEVYEGGVVYRARQVQTSVFQYLPAEWLYDSYVVVPTITK